MSKKNKSKKINKPVEESVNPIVFGCNALVDKLWNVAGHDLVDSYMEHYLSSVRDTGMAPKGSAFNQARDKEAVNVKRRLKVLPLTLQAHKIVTGEAITVSGDCNMGVNEWLCNVHVFPSEGCRIRKLSERATQFLLSLGQPSKELRVDYREHLYTEASSRPEETVKGDISGHFYEELIELPINGHTEYIYLISSTEMCLVLHRRDPKYGENEYFNIPVLPQWRVREMYGAEMDYDEDYDNWKSGHVFDVEALLANLWIAESTRTCEVCSEPEYSRHASDRPVLLAGKKPLKHSVAYRYIHITDETWKKYESASKCVREQKNFNVASWVVRAHYAKRHGKTVLVKAHYAYRRKGVVTETDVVDYIV